MRFKREDVTESAMLVATLRLPELLAMADTHSWPQETGQSFWALIGVSRVGLRSQTQERASGSA